MEWIGGTKKAKKLINELIKSGDLIDVYSKEYFLKRNDDEFNLETFEELITKNGDEFLHHILVGCFHGDHDKLMKLISLVEIDKYKGMVLMGHNAPSFLFINLRTQEIIVFGLWRRKAQTIESMIYSSGYASNIEFEELDYLNIVENIREEFEDIARGIYPTKDGLSIGELDELYKGKNGNFFYDEDEANVVDENDEDEGITQIEVDERYEELNYARELREEGESRLHYYFPCFSIDYLWE